MKKKVVVVDDHNLLLEAIGGLVRGFDTFEVPYLCKNGNELLEKLKFPDNKPDVVLMDINMPILNGIETTKILKEEYPDIKVLALSVEENEKTILKMLRAGAKGYLMKDTKKEILKEALNQVIEKGYYHTNTISKLLIGTLTKDETDVELKEREIEFLKYACTEMTYKEIAEKMFLSPKTIEGYRDSIYEKLHLKNRIGLVLYAIRNGYFKP
ncbi:response regulator transcription factor [Marixanthomonas sp. SCSIO 43207]|uniref:response regulator transcription factor n=1 Tax=Marixanthomonas sp. SCSIO 43207 TaxID=2779360 RepID=UPI001CA7EDEC|nr:response regulator transcription factor [Marixanthomonas sp. SCSIO 43207]UAB81032.1 response regulator transcription factor [Marixanthomonas sp. SCSIO 43207]